MKKQYALGGKQHMYLVTTDDRVDKVLSQLEEAEELDFYTVRIAILDVDRRGESIKGFPVVATFEDLYEDARKEVVDVAYINISYSTGKSLEKCISEFEKMGITVQLNINVLEGQEGFSKQIDMIGDYPVVSLPLDF